MELRATGCATLLLSHARGPVRDKIKQTGKRGTLEVCTLPDKAHFDDDSTIENTTHTYVPARYTNTSAHVSLVWTIAQETSSHGEGAAGGFQRVVIPPRLFCSSTSRTTTAAGTGRATHIYGGTAAVRRAKTSGLIPG